MTSASCSTGILVNSTVICVFDGMGSSYNVSIDFGNGNKKDFVSTSNFTLNQTYPRSGIYYITFNFVDQQFVKLSILYGNLHLTTF